MNLNLPCERTRSLSSGYSKWSMQETVNLLICSNRTGEGFLLPRKASPYWWWLTSSAKTNLETEKAKVCQLGLWQKCQFWNSATAQGIEVTEESKKDFLLKTNILVAFSATDPNCGKISNSASNSWSRLVICETVHLDQAVKGEWCYLEGCISMNRAYLRCLHPQLVELKLSAR